MFSLLGPSGHIVVNHSPRSFGGEGRTKEGGGRWTLGTGESLGRYEAPGGEEGGGTVVTHSRSQEQKYRVQSKGLPMTQPEKNLGVKQGGIGPGR